MKRITGILVIFGLAAGIALQPATAQTDELRNEPGYLDMTDIDGWFDEEPWLEINIRGALLRLITEASRQEDPELTDLLQRLKAIEVRAYPLTPEQFEDIWRRTGDLSKQLDARGWETVVRVREDDERVNIFMKSDGKVISGLIVMVLEPDDEEGAVFVNIVGDIDPAQVGRIGQKFDIDALTSFN